MKIEGVILAAGLSSRAGAFKPELPFGEKKLLEKVIEGMAPHCSRIIVVGGHFFERIRAVCDPYPHVSPVLNETYRRGMFSSVQTGVRRLDCDAFFLTPGDYPFISAEVYRLLAAAPARSPRRDIFIPAFQGRKGHPLLFRRAVAPAILAEPPDSTLRTVVRNHGFQLVEVPDDGILQDVDTMEDYKKLGAAPQPTWESD